MVRKGSIFACALMFSPVRMAGQTACPEGSLARARKHCEGGSRGCEMTSGYMRDWHFEI